MSMMEPVQIDTATPQQKKVLEGIKAKMGKVPNIYATIAHSPSTLEAMLSYSMGLKKGELTPREIEMIALAVGEKNSCHYCVAAHTVMGKMAGLTPEEMIAARQGKASDQKAEALLKLAVETVESKGHPAKETVEAFFKAGYAEGSLVEVVAWVSFNIFTNYINDVADTKLDFPPAPKIA